MSPYPRVLVGQRRRCGHPREAGTTKCRLCDKLGARARKAARLARVARPAAVPMRRGRPLVPAHIVALIEECRPAYLLAIAPRQAKGRAGVAP